MSFRVAVVCFLEAEEGQLPGADELAAAIRDALLARKPELWGFVYPASAVPLPAPTPAPAQHWRVKSAIVNLREGPGTTYKVLGQVRQGDTLTQTGEMQAGWLPTTQGWVSGSLVADLVAGRAPALDLAPFAPGRFR